MAAQTTITIRQSRSREASHSTASTTSPTGAASTSSIVDASAEESPITADYSEEEYSDEEVEDEEYEYSDDIEPSESASKAPVSRYASRDSRQGSRSASRRGVEAPETAFNPHARQARDPYHQQRHHPIGRRGPSAASDSLSSQEEGPFGPGGYPHYPGQHPPPPHHQTWEAILRHRQQQQHQQQQAYAASSLASHPPYNPFTTSGPQNTSLMPFAPHDPYYGSPGFSSPPSQSSHSSYFDPRQYPMGMVPFNPGTVPPFYSPYQLHPGMPPPAPSMSKEEEGSRIAKLEELIRTQELERVSREKEREAKLEAERKELEAQAAKDKAEKQKAADIADAAKKAQQAAETKAADEAKAAKEAHDKALAEAKAATEKAKEAEKKAQEEVKQYKPPDEDTLSPIRFKDAIGRKFQFPFKYCKTWKGMEELIVQAFEHVDVIGQEVLDGHYDLIGPEGEIVLPKVWEKTVKPDFQITMQMWPMKKEEPPPPPPPPMPMPMPQMPPPPVETDWLGRPKKGSKKKSKRGRPESLVMPPGPPPMPGGPPPPMMGDFMPMPGPPPGGNGKKKAAPPPPQVPPGLAWMAGGRVRSQSKKG